MKTPSANKTELDIYNGNVYVSLIGFMFENTRPLSVKIPFHINFGEVNLRFYVRHNDNRQWKRGAVFIKEIVPKPAISILANTLYHEKYRTSFSFLHNVNPNSVFMTQGSAISILKKQDI